MTDQSTKSVMLAAPLAALATAGLLGSAVLLLGGWDWLLKSVPEPEVIEVSFDQDGQACERKSLEGTKKKAKRADRDFLIWTIDNDCTQEVDVTIATYGILVPFTCVSEPSGADIEKTFKVKPDSTAFVICAVDYDKVPAEGKTFRFDIKPPATGVVGPQVMGASEIAIEVLP